MSKKSFKDETKLQLVLKDKDKQKSEMENGGRQITYKKHHTEKTGMKPPRFLLFKRHCPRMTWTVVPISQLRLSLITFPLSLLLSDKARARILVF